MGMDASAKLVYGIDFDEERPAFMGDYDGSLADWAEEKPQSRVMQAARYLFEGETILAVRGYVFEADYSARPIKTLTVDPDREEAFKEALRALGYENPQPQWLLACRVTF